MSKEVKQENTKVDFKNLSLGIVRDADGVWCVVKIVYDFTTKQAKVDEVVRAGGFSEAQERFRILAANELFMNQ